MALAIVLTRARNGIDAPLTHVEVHLANGLPSLSIVGLPEAAVRESKDRVRSAIQNANLEFPARRITVNLAPADLPKDGGRFDLPIALGILCGAGHLPPDALKGHEFVGELALGGELRAVQGVLPVSIAATEAGHALFVPSANAREAGLATHSRVYPARHLLEVCAHLTGARAIAPHRASPSSPGDAPATKHGDLSDVRGQHHAKRALMVAAAGQHNMLMVGPPGTGKTMLARRLPGLLPAMTDQEALETAALRSVGGQDPGPDNWGVRPFRAPHHTASGVALVGGGSHPRPGEVSLAHNGVLFLDELTEFNARVLDVLREPLETGRISIARAARQADFPARFQLVAAMNPCPQGYDCDLSQRCRCTPEQQRRHRRRISAPFLDRIDLHIQVQRAPREVLRPETTPDGLTSAAARTRVANAHTRQLERQGCVNARLEPTALAAVCRLDTQCHDLLARAMERFRLSPRAYHRILKVARTLADLENEPGIGSPQVSEAISFRSLERIWN